MSYRQTHRSTVIDPKALLTVVLTLVFSIGCGGDTEAPTESTSPEPVEESASTGIAGLFAVTSPASAAQAITFNDVKRQTHEFIEYYDSIQLSAAQEAVKKEALTALPAPCCSDNTAYTCCCPCNMSRTIWGLSHYLITKHNYNANKVREKVSEWIRFINPTGFSGNICYIAGGCGRPFSKNGCGGMNKARVIF